MNYFQRLFCSNASKTLRFLHSACGWKDWGEIAMPMKREAPQKNLQQIAATEPYAILPVYTWSVCSSWEFEARQDKYIVEIQKK